MDIFFTMINILTKFYIKSPVLSITIYVLLMIGSLFFTFYMFISLFKDKNKSHRKINRRDDLELLNFANEHDTLFLSDNDFNKLEDIINFPPPPNENLKNAFLKNKDEFNFDLQTNQDLQLLMDKGNFKNKKEAIVFAIKNAIITIRK